MLQSEFETTLKCGKQLPSAPKIDTILQLGTYVNEKYFLQVVNKNEGRLVDALTGYIVGETIRLNIDSQHPEKISFAGKEYLLGSVRWSESIPLYELDGKKTYLSIFRERGSIGPVISIKIHGAKTIREKICAILGLFRIGVLCSDKKTEKNSS